MFIYHCLTKNVQIIDFERVLATSLNNSIIGCFTHLTFEDLKIVPFGRKVHVVQFGAFRDWKASNYFASSSSN